MSDKLDATISISADTSGVEAGIDKTKKSLKTLGTAAQQTADQMGKSGKGAGAGFEAIGTGVAKSAKDVERATRSMQQQLQRQIAELNAGGKATREYTEALARMRGVDTRALAPLLDQLDQARKKTDAASSSFAGFKAAAAAAVAGLSVGAFVSEIAAITRETVNAAAEIERFSALSNTTTKDFQRLAAGANTVGISAEKMADIVKDVQDKVGDFVQTGGGGMADFFERVAPKVGVTAEQFRKLSGKDALQLYVSSLEKANLAHSDMVFFMEAVASDSSLLLPLLKDQGQAWQDLGDKAEAYGAVMDGQALAAAKAFKTESDNLELSLKGLRIELAEGLLPSMTQFVAVLSDPSTRSALSDLAGWIGDVAVSAVELSSVIGGAGVWGWLQTGNVEAKDAAAEIAKVEAQMAKVRETRDALERAGGGWLHAEDIAVANSQLSTMEAKLRGLQVMAQQYQVQQAAALKSMGRSVGLSWLESYVPEAERPQALSPAYSKPTQKSASLKAEESAYKSLAKSIADLLAQQNLEISTGEKLTNAQKLRMKVEQEVAKSKQAGLLAQIDEIEAGEAWLKNQTDVNKALADMQRAREQSLKSVQDSVRQLLDEAEAAAYAETHNVSLAEAVERLALARAEDAYQQAVVRGESQQTLDYLRREIEARKELVAATAQKAAREANKKAAEQAAKDWEKVSQTIGDTLADYIMSGGKDAATYLKRLFSTLVLQPVVQTMVSGVLGTGAAAASGVASGGVGGLLNQLGNSGGGFTNWSSWGATSSDWLMTQSTKLGLNGMQGLSDAAYSLGNTIQGVDNWLKELPGMEGGIGSAVGYAQAIYALTQGNYGSAIGSAIGTYVLPGIGTMIGSTLGSLVDGAFGGGTPHGGAAAGYSGGQITDFGKGFTRKQINSDYTSGMQAGVSAVAATVGQSFDALAAVLGKQGGYRVTTGFSADSDDPAWGRLQIYDAVGEALVDWNAGRYGPKDTRLKSQFSSDPEKAFDQYLQSVAASSLPALKDIAPAWADAMIDSVTQAIGFDGNSWKSITVSGQEALTAMQSVVQQIAMVEAGFASLGNVMSMFSGISDDMKTALLGGLGGIEGVTQAAGIYYNAFYSEEERLLAAAQQVNQVLTDLQVFSERGGLDVLGEGAKAKFRQAVEEVGAAGNGEMLTQLLGLAGAFDQVASNAHRLGAAVDSVGEALSEVMLDLLDERKSLEAELLRAQGNEAGYLAAIRAISTDSYTEAERAAWDYNAALQSQIDALDAAAAIASERAGLERQLLQLQGNTAALRAIERAALDESNRALYDRITALQDEQAAAQAAQQATQSAYANLQAAVNREKTYWQGIASASQSAISSLSSTLNLLTSNAQALYGGVDSAQQWQAAQGMVYIENALAAVRGGADVAGFDGLTDAITAARGGINEGAYATAFERERDALVLAGQLSQLGELTDAQLTVEERALKAAQQQIERLDKTLDYWQQQIDGTNGLINVGMSVQQAIDALAATMANGFSSLAAAKAAAMQPYSVSDTPAQRQEKVEAQTGVKVSPSDSALVAAAKVLYQSINGGASTSEYNAAAAAVGGNIAQAVGWDGTREGAEELRKMYGFAVGTNYVPYDMTARIHEGEAIVPKAFNPWAGGTGISGNNAELLTELRALREQNARLEQRLAAIEGNTHKTAQVLVDVTDDGNAMVTQELETL